MHVDGAGSHEEAKMSGTFTKSSRLTHCFVKDCVDGLGNIFGLNGKTCILSRPYVISKLLEFLCAMIMIFLLQRPAQGTNSK
jgi:hypothetical protein